MAVVSWEEKNLVTSTPQAKKEGTLDKFCCTEEGTFTMPFY